MNSIVIGKRIPLGMVVGGVITILVHLWNLTHPEAIVTTEIAMAANTVAVGIAQIFVVNKFGVTPQ